MPSMHHCMSKAKHNCSVVLDSVTLTTMIDKHAIIAINATARLVQWWWGLNHDCMCAAIVL